MPEPTKPDLSDNEMLAFCLCTGAGIVSALAAGITLVIAAFQVGFFAALAAGMGAGIVGLVVGAILGLVVYLGAKKREAKKKVAEAEKAKGETPCPT